MHIVRNCRGMSEVWKLPQFSLPPTESRLSFWAWVLVDEREVRHGNLHSSYDSGMESMGHQESGSA